MRIDAVDRIPSAKLDVPPPCHLELANRDRFGLVFFSAPLVFFFSPERAPGNDLAAAELLS
jgi:hypothetical protein